MLVETLYEASSQLLFDNINKDGEKYFPFIFVIFTFVLVSNLIGLIPYSFTATSHLIVTFSLSFSIFIGINIICIQKHKFNLFSPKNERVLSRHFKIVTLEQIEILLKSFANHECLIYTISTGKHFA